MRVPWMRSLMEMWTLMNLNVLHPFNTAPEAGPPCANLAWPVMGWELWQPACRQVVAALKGRLFLSLQFPH